MACPDRTSPLGRGTPWRAPIQGGRGTLLLEDHVSDYKHFGGNNEKVHQERILILSIGASWIACGEVLKGLSTVKTGAGKLAEFRFEQSADIDGVRDSVRLP
jgi:hypothetical protein